MEGSIGSIIESCFLRKQVYSNTLESCGCDIKYLKKWEPIVYNDIPNNNSTTNSNNINIYQRNLIYINKLGNYVNLVQVLNVQDLITDNYVVLSSFANVSSLFQCEYCNYTLRFFIIINLIININNN